MTLLQQADEERLRGEILRANCCLVGRVGLLKIILGRAGWLHAGRIFGRARCGSSWIHNSCLTFVVYYICGAGIAIASYHSFKSFCPSVVLTHIKAMSCL
jgi:hypothetical protein